MRIVNVGCGEIADRLTVLALKILHGQEANRDVKHFVDERNALLAQLRGRTLNGAWFEHVLELAAVNAWLWQMEDGLRDLRQKPEKAKVLSEDIVTFIAFKIQSLNDRRAELRETINKLTGEHLGEEKL